MNTTDKKLYMIPETELLSLGSIHSLMKGSPNLLNPTPEEPEAGEFGAPGRKVF